MSLTEKMNEIIGFVPAKKKRAEDKLQAVGRQIGSNISQGQKDLKSGAAPYYGSINPLKGIIDAFKKG